MDPYTLSKIGNVTIQPIPSKSDISDNRKKDTSVESSPKPLQSIHLPKFPPSIDITIKSANITAEVNESGNTLTDTNTEKLIEDDFNSEYHEEIKLKEQNESENTVVDGDTLVNFEPETCDKTENKLNEEFLESSFENSTEVDSEGERNDLDADNAVDIVQKMDLEGITEGEVLEPADVLEELPRIKDELVDNEGFKEDEEQCSDDIPNIPVEELIEDELPEEMMCKEEKFSDEEEESESDDADDELDEKQTTTKSSSKKKRKTKSEGDTKDLKKQKTSSPSSGKMLD